MYTDTRLMIPRTMMSVVLALAVQLFGPWPTTRDAALATPPSITTQPNNKAVCDCGSYYSGKANFFCGATGTPPLSFQWRRGTTNLTNGGNIAGATSNQMVIWPGRLSDAAVDYNCLVTNAEGSAVTNNVTLTVWPTGTADVNGDGAADGRDVQAFLNVWLAPRPPLGALTASYCAADMDGNGSFGCEDLCVFAQVLLQSPQGCGVQPENDDCPNATLVITGVLYNGSTGYATRDGPPSICEIGSGCGLGCYTAPDVWYRWLADFSGSADFSMCPDFPVPQYDTLMAIYDDCPSMGGVELTCNDDTFACVSNNTGLSRICGFTVNAGQTYWICASGWGGQKGCFSFRVNPGGCN